MVSNKGKPGVEGGVKNAYQRIYYALRNCIFYSIDDLNESIMEQQEEYNDTPFKEKPEWTRKKAFKELEKDKMLPLPPVSYEERDGHGSSREGFKCKMLRRRLL